MPKILIIDNDNATKESLRNFLRALLYQTIETDSLDEAFEILSEDDIYVVFSTLNLNAGYSSKAFYQELAEENDNLPFWVFYSSSYNTNDVKEVCGYGALDILKKPFISDDIKSIFKRISRMHESPLNEILDIVQSITGVQLGTEKKLLVETRLLRRMRQINVDTHDEYLVFFKENRITEIDEIVSLLTTHTTEFFRENEHFKYLQENVYPRLANKKVVRVLSAASSSGEELYSLSISFLDYLKKSGIPKDNYPKLEFVGSDVDYKVVEMANEGIYETRVIERLSPEILKQYFDEGTGELEGFYRIKEFAHKHCRFQMQNLMDDNYQLVGKFDVIFLRNVLIYFNATQVEKIANKLQNLLTPDGLLFLGHSESLSHVKNSYDLVTNSIYKIKNIDNGVVIDRAFTDKIKENLSKFKNKNPSILSFHFRQNDIVLLGASTGGTEAIKVVLDQLPEQFPPILIVQHIPAGFSETFAKRLNDTCLLNVLEATSGVEVKSSHVYIAPGGKQMKVRSQGSKLILDITDDDPQNRHKPSVGFLFDSFKPYLKNYQTTAVMLTGMGSDGAREMKELHDLGVKTIGQDEKTSVVYGMPKVAFELGAIDVVSPLCDIHLRIMDTFADKKK